MYSYEKFPRQGHCCAAIGSDIYMFGLDNTRIKVAAPLWKLTTINGLFEWDTINTNNSNVPSPRSGHCAWAYGQQVWIFGGFGVSPTIGFLNDHGDFASHLLLELGFNNQVLYYDPSNYMWTNATCSGNVPSPRQHASLRTDFGCMEE